MIKADREHCVTHREIPDWYKALVEISMIVERLAPEERVKLIDQAFCEFCPKCGLTNVEGRDHACVCSEDL